MTGPDPTCLHTSHPGPSPPANLSSSAIACSIFMVLLLVAVVRRNALRLSLYTDTLSTRPATMTSAGDEKSTVMLVSEDGFQYIISRSYVAVSPVLSAMLKKHFLEGATGKCHLRSMAAEVLETVCEYIYFNYKYRTTKRSKVPNFVLKNQGIGLSILLAADYLDVA